MPEIGLREAASNALVLKYQRLLDEQLACDFNPPAQLSGRGIVLCAGGPRYFTCAWVLIHQLRETLRCDLPIQVWYAGPEEMDEPMLALLRALPRVELVDATQVAGYERIRSLGGWPLKPFAIVHSRYREVLLLDADNLPIVNPQFLFDHPRYIETGAIFWPDLFPLTESSPIWEVTRVPYRLEPSFESGQILVDKSRCWKPLMLTMHLNENAKFYYRLIHGDKDTFHFAWHLAGQEYSMPAGGLACLSPAPHPSQKESFPVLLQREFDGTVIFQHRNAPKWTAFGVNAEFPGFCYEKECLVFLDRLAGVWDGRIRRSNSPPAQYWHSPVGTRWFRYILIGAENRPMEFLPDGRIGCGAHRSEQRWAIVQEQGEPVLLIIGDYGVTCRLTRKDDHVWRGSWVFNELHSVELIPFPQRPED